MVAIFEKVLNLNPHILNGTFTLICNTWINKKCLTIKLWVYDVTDGVGVVLSWHEFPSLNLFFPTLKKLLNQKSVVLLDAKADGKGVQQKLVAQNQDVI